MIPRFEEFEIKIRVLEEFVKHLETKPTLYCQNLAIAVRRVLSRCSMDEIEVAFEMCCEKLEEQIKS